jgi:hypothetical protein
MGAHYFDALDKSISEQLGEVHSLVQYSAPSLGRGSRWFLSHVDGLSEDKQLPAVRAYSSEDGRHVIFYAFKDDWLRPDASHVVPSDFGADNTAAAWVLAHLESTPQ